MPRALGFGFGFGFGFVLVLVFGFGFGLGVCRWVVGRALLASQRGFCTRW